MFPPGTAFCLSGTFNKPQHEITRLLARNGARCMLKVKRTDYLVIGNKASMLDMQRAYERSVPIITESQLDAWIKWDQAPKVLPVDQAMAVANGLEYDFVWGDKPADFGAF